MGFVVEGFDIHEPGGSSISAASLSYPFDVSFSLNSQSMVRVGVPCLSSSSLLRSPGFPRKGQAFAEGGHAQLPGRNDELFFELGAHGSHPVP